MNISSLKAELKKAGDPEKAKDLSRFFKTGKGQYGEGDVFIGVRVPLNRKISRKYINLSLADIKEMLNSPVHEYRFAALEILVYKYRKGDAGGKKRIFEFYLSNLRNVNNWDLVDTSAPHIIGDYIYTTGSRLPLLEKLARSRNLWERRISVISTFAFIKQNSLEPTLRIVRLLMNDEHDLIHKACGWMLRELGKRSLEKEESFILRYMHAMPRTMLRYAIERFPEPLRKSYLSKE